MKNNKSSIRSLVFLVLSVMVLILIDQGIKAWALSSLQEHSIEVIPGVFRFSYVENRGAAFGILQGHPLFLGIVSAVVLLALIYVFRSIPKVKGYYWAAAAFALLMAGAVGNLIDRFGRNYVVDMFDFCLIHFPVFNFADICVVTGTGLLILLMFLRKELFADLLEKGEKSSKDVNADQKAKTEEAESGACGPEQGVTMPKQPEMTEESHE